MAPKRLLVKRHGHMEEFDERKVYASIYSAALNAHHSEEEAERIADKATRKVLSHVNTTDSITADEIKQWVVTALGGLRNDTAYLYTHHLDIN